MCRDLNDCGQDHPDVGPRPLEARHTHTVNQLYPLPATRRLMTFFMTAAAIMNQIDTTIANVVLPHIQGSTSASRERIARVLSIVRVVTCAMVFLLRRPARADAPNPPTVAE